MSILRVSR